MRRSTEVTTDQAFILVASSTKPERALSMKSQPRDDWNVKDFRLDSQAQVGFWKIQGLGTLSTSVLSGRDFVKEARTWNSVQDKAPNMHDKSSLEYSTSYLEECPLFKIQNPSLLCTFLKDKSVHKIVLRKTPKLRKVSI